MGVFLMMTTHDDLVRVTGYGEHGDHVLLLGIKKRPAGAIRSGDPMVGIASGRG